LKEYTKAARKGKFFAANLSKKADGKSNFHRLYNLAKS
jgi:hypothetical protein